MNKEATKEYTLKMRERYSAMQSKTAKSRVLDDFCLTTSYERKYVIKILNKQSNQNRKKSLPENDKNKNSTRDFIT